MEMEIYLFTFKADASYLIQVCLRSHIRVNRLARESRCLTTVHYGAELK